MCGGRVSRGLFLNIFPLDFIISKYLELFGGKSSNHLLGLSFFITTSQQSCADSPSTSWPAFFPSSSRPSP